jgi:hypothetical protein
MYADKVTAPLSAAFTLPYLPVSRDALLSVAINLSFQSVRNVECTYIYIYIHIERERERERDH